MERDDADDSLIWIGLSREDGIQSIIRGLSEAMTEATDGIECHRMNESESDSVSNLAFTKLLQTFDIRRMLAGSFRPFIDTNLSCLTESLAC